MSPSPSEQVYQSAGAPRVAPRPGAGATADAAGPRNATAAAPTGTATATAPASPGAGAGVGAGVGAGYAQTRPAAASVPSAAPGSAPRKVRLTVARVDPWSVLKLSFLLSVAMGIGMVTAAVILWEVINSMGVLDQLNKMLQEIAGSGSGSGSKFDLYSYVGLGRVVSLSTFIAVINIIILMALCTLGAFLYNIAATLVGGLHVTLSDD